MKRFVSLLLAICLLAACLPLSAGAADQIVEIRGDEQLTLEGVLTECTYQINSSNTGHAYLLKLNEEITVSLFDSYMGYNGKNINIQQVQLNFSNLSANIADKVNSPIKVTGKAMIGHNAHHLTPVVLTETEIVSEEQEENSQDFEIFENVTDMQQELYFNGTHIATITLPESWKGHLAISKSSNSIGFYSLLNMKNPNANGGLLFCLIVTSDTRWRNWPHTYLCREFKIDGQQYYLVYNGPSDVRFDYNDPACREEYQMMYADTDQKIIDKIIYHVGSDDPDDSPSPFSDVFSDDYYKEAVEWAVEQGIANGTGNGKFSPEAACTRAQIVTFLWRAAGSPEPTSGLSMFSDVKTNEYYEKAVRWAIEQGITNGTGNGKFSPEAACTRGQAVTFLWRAAGEPSAGTAGFSDVCASDYYAPAVNWAVQNDVTAGTGNNRFSPNWKCTRAQIVTFLYRYAN